MHKETTSLSCTKTRGMYKETMSLQIQRDYDVAYLGFMDGSVDTSRSAGANKGSSAADSRGENDRLHGRMCCLVV